MIERAIVLARGDHITLDDIPNLAESAAARYKGGIRETVGVMEKQMIAEALIKADWVQTKAAALLRDKREDAQIQNEKNMPSHANRMTRIPTAVM